MNTITNTKGSTFEKETLGDIEIQYKNSWILLPIVSAILVIGTLPPLNFWFLGFLALAPLYIFVSITVRTSWKKVAWGGFIFGVLFSAFLMTLTILQFHWIEGAHLFSTLVKFSFIPLLIVMGFFASVSILVSRFLIITIARSSVKILVPEHMFSSKKFVKILSGLIELFTILSATVVWTLSEWVIRKLMFGIEYSIIGYPAHNTFFISLASVGGVFLTVFAVTLINMSIGSLLYQSYKYMTTRKRSVGQANPNNESFVNSYSLTPARCLPSIFFILISISLGLLANRYSNNLVTAESAKNVNLKVALIQDQNRKDNTFGGEVQGVFRFKTLENLMHKANEQAPDMIIYPFAPWNGVIYDKEKDKQDIPLYNKDVFATSFQTFGAWQKIHTRNDTVFVTWATTYRDKKFYNEITFWKNGELIGYHQKEHLFPFLDYTPKFAQSYGLYTTAVDGTPGTTTLSEKIHNIDMGALVCSEVTHQIFKSTSKSSDLVLSLGSEAFFSNGIAGDLNVASAAYRAAESGKSVIRANRFGPSAFIDGTGKKTSYVPFGTTGFYIHNVSVPLNNRDPFYARLFLK